MNLLTDFTFISMTDMFVIFSTDPPKRAAALTQFKNIWTKYLPNVMITKPRMDLCWACAKNSRAIKESANLSESKFFFLNGDGFIFLIF